MAKNGKQSGKRNGNGHGKGNGRKRAPKPATVVTEEPATTIEDLSDEDRRTLFFDHKRKLKELEATAKLAADAVKAGYKLASAEGVTKKEIKLALKLESDEGEAEIAADIARAQQVAKWMGVPLGAQADPFGSDGDKYEDQGKRAAMNDEARKAPGNIPQHETARWYAGFDKGRTAVNAMRAQQFRPLADTATH